MKYKIGEKVLCHKVRGSYKIGQWYRISYCSDESVFIENDNPNNPKGIGCWFSTDKWINDWKVFKLCDYFYTIKEYRIRKIKQINEHNNRYE